MNLTPYQSDLTAELLMGPNSLRILQSLFHKYPLHLSKDQLVLDLGCGKGLTSYAIARETGARVYASDLWIAAEDNAKRFDHWGVSDRVTPVHEDANDLHFTPKMFDALLSIDAYHYFGTGEGFFQTRILPFLKDGAVALIGVPGMKDAYAGKSRELMTPWLGEEAYMFQSPSEWKAIIGQDERIASVDTWEMDCFDAAWDEWFQTGHRFAQGDLQFFDSLIKPYTCFVGICIRLK